jgi:4-hydroxy-2-oxoglutarate aldolase
MQPANLLAFYRTVADRSPIPVLIYSVPVFTNYDMAAELVIELAGHPNIIGIKESGGDVEKIKRMAEGTRHIKRSAAVTETFAAVTPRMLKSAGSSFPSNNELIPVGALAGNSRDLVQKDTPSSVEQRSAPASSSPAINLLGGIKTRQKEVGFQILAGAAHKLHPSLDAGAVGAVLAFANPAPTACYEIYAAWKEGDAELASLKQERISKASMRVGSQMGIPGMKYALDLNGYYGGPSRLPLLPLTVDLKREVEQLMSDIRN